MKQTFLNAPEDCQWLRETHLKPSNWNNELIIPDFKSFCLFGNEDCPREILLYQNEHPTVNETFCVRATLADNGCYSFSTVRNT